MVRSTASSLINPSFCTRLLASTFFITASTSSPPGTCSEELERRRGGGGLWALGFGLLFPVQRGAYGPTDCLYGEARLRRTSLTRLPCGLWAGHTPSDGYVHVLLDVEATQPAIRLCSHFWVVGEPWEGAGVGGGREGRTTHGYLQGPDSPCWRCGLLPLHWGRKRVGVEPTSAIQQSMGLPAQPRG